MSARVALIEDDPILREAVTRTISLAPDLEFVAAAETAAAGRAMLDTPMEVLLIDLALPDGSGIDLIREASARFPNLKIIVVSIFGDASSVVNAIEAGAHGYLLKSADPGEAADAIRAVLAGGAPISPAVAGHILARIRGRASVSPAASTPLLSDKEVAILTELSKGFRYKEVARLHGISPNTVGDHVKSIYRKLAVNSRSEAVFEAVQAGIIQLKD